MASWCEESFSKGVRLSLETTNTLFSEQSPYQLVEVFDTRPYGRTLMIDGVFMTSEKDECFYHEMLVHPAMVSGEHAPQQVLIVGGGDGGTLREVLSYPSVQNATLVEIDEVVVRAAKAHLPSLGATAWQDPRLDLRIANGIDFVAQAADASFDRIFIDGTDPAGPGEVLFDTTFFRHCQRVLKPQGVLALQTESPVLLEEAFFAIQTRLREVFAQVRPYFGPVPIYGAGTWSWTWNSAAGDPLCLAPERRAHAERRCHYYNGAVHQAAFALPNFVARQLQQPQPQRSAEGQVACGNRP